MSIVNILFMSDLHFKTEFANRLETCANEYIETLSRLSTKWKPSVIAICGDIGFSGKVEEYELCNRLLIKPLKENLSIKSKNIIVCPGNHDKADGYYADRYESGEVEWVELESAVTPPDISKKNYTKDRLKQIKEKNLLGKRLVWEKEKFVLDKYTIKPFENYISFLKEIQVEAFKIDKFIPEIKDKSIENKAKYLYGIRNIEGIQFYCYNSAWDCFHQYGSDKGHLRIGPVVSDTAITDDKSSIKISMVHHPSDWLNSEDIGSLYYNKNTISLNVDFAVNGHMHSAIIRRDEEGNKVLIQLPTWNSTDTDLKEWESYIISIDTDTGNYSRLHIGWQRRLDGPMVSVSDIRNKIAIRLKEKNDHLEMQNTKFRRKLIILLLNKLNEFKNAQRNDLWRLIQELLQLLLDDYETMRDYKELESIIKQYENHEEISLDDALIIENGLNKALSLTAR